MRILREARKVNNWTDKEKYDTIEKLKMDKFRITKKYKKNEKTKLCNLQLKILKRKQKGSVR